MSLSPDAPPEMLRSGTTRVLRRVPDRAATPIQIERLEALPYTMDGRPITSELRAAKDAGFRRGWERGWADGIGAGREQAYQEFSATLAPTLAAVTEAAQQLAASDRLTLKEAERSLVKFAFDVVEAVLLRELALGTEPVIESLQRALALAPDRGDVVARLHPDDVAIIEAVEHLVPGRTLQIVPDPHVARGGAVVEVGVCQIDGQLDSALARVRAVLDGVA